MPFQSEKQRRYLWANEPKIARDWADTYGSRIKKDDGGIMDVPRRRYFSGKYGQGAGDRGGDPRGSKSENIGRVAQNTFESRNNQPDTPHKPVDRFQQYSKNIVNIPPPKEGGDWEDQRPKKESWLRKQEKKGIDNFVKRTKYKNLMKAGVFKNLPPSFLSQIFGYMKPDDEVDMFDEDSIREIASKYGGNLTKKQVTGLGDFRKDLEFEKQFPNATTTDMRKYYGLDKPHIPDGGPDGYMGYPSYAAWLAAQGGGGGGGATVPPPVDEESEFQKSLTGTADTPDYYVGNNPLASNIAWGKQAGVDPRTMGMTSFAADGGRIPAAFGGIMDTDTGRRAYGFGSFFKKIGRAAKKVFKSPIGKAALLAGGAYMLGGANFLGGSGMFQSGQGLQRFANLKNLKDTWGFKQLLTGGGKDDKYAGKWNPWKLGIGAATALPFLMGGEKEDEGSKFDYEGAKNAYADEIMRIKRGAMAGSLDPNEWNYLGVKDGGRIGLYAGGQSVPSDYTMEDAMMTTTQDKLGGITDVMKQADLSRAGSVGQFYAAQGGRIGFAGGMNEKLAELKKAYNTYIEGGGTLSFEKFSAAFAEENFAQGGRIGAQEGGLMDLGGMEKDYRNDGGFVPLGGEEKADDVPARLSKNEFVFTADAVRGAGDGDIDKGAEIMENIMKNLEQGGQISEETQGLSGAQEMFGVSERLSEVV